MKYLIENTGKVSFDTLKRKLVSHLFVDGANTVKVFADSTILVEHDDTDKLESILEQYSDYIQYSSVDEQPAKVIVEKYDKDNLPAQEKTLLLLKGIILEGNNPLKRIFLGGVINSKWRDELIPFLDKLGVEYFNPVVDDWAEDDIENEEKEKQKASHILYVITPELEGYYSIAELVYSAVKYPEKTLVVIDYDYGNKEFNSKQQKSLDAVVKLITKETNVQVFDNLEELKKYLTDLKG